MHLKQIEVYGFKSFADKLILDFNDGVTCIVGPNGCGKSNISDAIRWVLGEQNAQDLRTGKGNKMEQVIFKGTDNRKPMSFCEVSLTFDNKSRSLQIDADEVVITRKMYRTGDSEYYINHQRDKLRNIIDLLRDTGIGKDGYSVIGQGKIDSFLTAKPEDRRQIFEEAAGISKYKANRKEAMKRLEKTQANLDLTSERLHSFEERMEPLIKQAEVARKAGEIKEKIKNLEVNHFIFVTEHSEEQTKKLQGRLDDATTALEEAKKKQSDTNAEYEAVTAKRASLDEEYRVVYERMVQLTEIAATKNSAQQRLSDSIKQAEQFVEEKKIQLEANKKTLEEDNAARAEYIEEQKQVVLDYEKARDDQDRYIDEYIQADKAVSEMRSKIDITNNVILDTMSKSISMTGDVAQLKTEKISMEKNVAMLKEEISDRKAQLADVAKRMKAENENIETLDADRTEKKEARKKIDMQYHQKFALKRDAEDRLAEIRDTITQKKTWITYQESTKANFSNYDQAVKNIMMCGDKNITSKVCGVVGNLIEVAPKYALAIETGLGGNINNMITRNQQDTSFLIDFLVSRRGGRGTFLPLTAMRPRPLESIFDEALEEEGCYGVASDLVKINREFRPAIEVLLGRVLVVEDKDTAIRMAAKYKNAFRMVTLTGENYAVTGAVTGGKVQGNNSHMLSLETEIANYKKQVEELEKQRKGLFEEISLIDKELKELEKTNDVINNVVLKLDKDISAAEQRKQYIILEQAKLNSEIDKMEASIADYQKQIAEKSVLLAAEEQKMGNQTDMRTDANDLLAKMNEEVLVLERQREEANIKRTDMISKVKTLESRNKELLSLIAGLEREIERLGMEILNATSQINVKSAEAATNREELERMVLENSDNILLKQAKEERDAIDAERNNLSLKQNALYAEMQQRADEVNEVNELKTRAETMIENLKKEIETAREKVKEEYGLDYESALEHRIENYSDHAGIQETKSLKKDLVKLGEVNEMAISDLEEMQKEYNGIKIHYDDVLKARDMINDSIAELTAKMESNFTDSFNKIKANFAAVFSEMFDGGKGKLDLDIGYGESVLDAGIIIEAEPPGKKLQNIDLLSGGERALTAIAIIFAIIKLNPVPFCILDEVDAPLDDSNSFVYAKYLRKFSKNTQFIIVSHRKPTMELANELYGVTMQEKGVSKVLAVKLDDAIKIAEEANNGGVFGG